MKIKSKFTAFASVISIVGCILAIIAALISSSLAFKSSVIASSIVGGIFSIQSTHFILKKEEARLALATMTTIFGIWFVLAPLLYKTGFISTAGTQFAGLLTASFSGYITLESIEKQTRK